MYSDTTFESIPKKRLEWVAQSAKNNGKAKGALYEFLQLLGKTDNEIQKPLKSILVLSGKPVTNEINTRNTTIN